MEAAQSSAHFPLYLRHTVQVMYKGAFLMYLPKESPVLGVGGATGEPEFQSERFCFSYFCLNNFVTF